MEAKDAENSSHYEGKPPDKSAGGRDIAANLAEQFANEPDYDRAEEVKLRWKIDRRLIPILFLNITLPAMDKITPSTGALYGLREDLGLKGDEYSWVGSAFYVSLSLAPGSARPIY